MLARAVTEYWIRSFAKPYQCVMNLLVFRILVATVQILLAQSNFFNNDFIIIL